MNAFAMHFCPHCGEGFGPGEPSDFLPRISLDGALEHRRFHRECAIRMVVGSVGHLLRRCSCFGGAMEDPSELTRREAAAAALAIARVQIAVDDVV